MAYSGGKDSTATLLWALEHLPREQIRVMYNSVGDGIDPPENDCYLPYIESNLDVTIETVKAGDRPLPPLHNGKKRQLWQQATSFLEMVKLRKMWPGWKARYCTTYLKQWPTVLWAKELPQPVVMLTGQRRADSIHRLKLPRFSGSPNWKQTRDGLPIYRPILNWSTADVWKAIDDYGLERNPVYNRSSRCNCGICFQARHCEILNLCRLYPNTAKKAANLEQEIKHNWTRHKSITNLLRQSQAQLPLFNWIAGRAMHRPGG